MKKFVVTLMAALAITTAWAATDAAQVLTNLKARIAPDGRTALWNVQSTTQNDVLTVYGTVGTQQQKDAVTAELKANGIDAFSNQLIVLENTVAADKRWAQIKLSMATLRTSGRHAAEVACQGIMGMPVKVLEINDEDGWAHVQMPDDYIAWVPTSSLAYKTPAQLAAWRSAKRVIVSVYSSELTSAAKDGETVSDLVMGCILEVKGSKGKMVNVVTPDGREGWVPAADVQDVDAWAAQSFDANLILRVAKRLLGSSYMWGANTTKATDCSGLVKVCYYANGIILQRDASQQALTGMKIAGDQWQQCRQGDLLFFGNSTTGRVTHVGIYMQDGNYIHCSGQVKVNSLDPNNATWLYNALSASRIDGQIGTRGIVAAKNHPWYF